MTGTRININIMLLAGGDLIQSFAVPNLWNESDVCIFKEYYFYRYINLSIIKLKVGSYPWKLWVCNCRKNRS